MGGGIHRLRFSRDQPGLVYSEEKFSPLSQPSFTLLSPLCHIGGQVEDAGYLSDLTQMEMSGLFLATTRDSR